MLDGCREITVEITLIEMTQNIKKLPSCRLHLNPSFIFYSYLLSFTTVGWALGTHAFTSSYTRWRLNIISCVSISFCIHLPSPFPRFSTHFSPAVVFFTTFLSIQCPISSFLCQQPPFSVFPRSDTRRLAWRWLYVSVHMLADPNWTPILKCACGSCVCLAVYLRVCVWVGVWTRLNWSYKMRVDGHTPLSMRHRRESQAHTHTHTLSAT